MTDLDPFASMVGEPEPDEPEPVDEPEPQISDEMSSLGDVVVTALREGTTIAAVMERIAQSEPIAQNSPVDAFSAPVGAPDPDPSQTSVWFPVVAAGQVSVDMARLLDPAQRVAEIVEALEPVLAPPPVVRDLEALVATANALDVVDADSYKAGCDLYELLAANEKGIEDTIGLVVSWFHRPWEAMCTFRRRFTKPVAEAKKRLSDDCGRWKLAEDRRAKVEADRLANEAAAQERERLRQLATEATTAAAAAPAASPLREVLEQTAGQATEAAKHVTPIPQPMRSGVPQTATKGRKTYEAVIVDADAFYKALVEDATRRVAAPIDQAYLNRQANDLKDELGNRFPGVECREKGGLTANGGRR